MGRKPKCLFLFQIYKQMKPRTLLIPLLGERERVAVAQGQERQLVYGYSRWRQKTHSPSRKGTPV